MLRLFVILLLLANGLFFAWSKGFLSQFGFVAYTKNESFRLATQIEPERIVVTQKDAASSQPPTNTRATSSSAHANTAITAQPSTVATTVCLTAGAFNERQSVALKQALNATIPDLSWKFEDVTLPERWIVYMGKYPNKATRDLKKSQLKQLNVRYEVLSVGTLEPGLSLGSHTSQAAAHQSLQQLFKKGVRTARVLQESPEQKGHTLVVPAADDVARAKLTTVYTTIAAQIGGNALQVCQ
jgi:hypothetical protein